ncbi:MAG: NTP transferase domain-containing protein [Melioribacteraceae bacterium]|nr:NTP transferase domain-containing protein [Melioribacteraceae bacterium]
MICTKYNIAGILIASGYSIRMGKFKPLLNYGGLSFLSGTVLKLSLVCKNITVVAGYRGELIKEELDNLFSSHYENEILNNYIDTAASKTKTIFNEKYASGMFTSLKAGLKMTPGNDWYIYHFVDQPAIPVGFYHDFVENINPDYDWIQPVFNNTKSHPILLSKKAASKILRASDNSNLKDVSSGIKQKLFWNCGYKEVVNDIDLYEEYSFLVKSSNVSILNDILEIIN